LQGTVVFAEPRNENVLINVEIGSFNIFALASHKPELQAMVHLKLNMDAVHLFDPETGANLSRAQSGTHRL
jgi:hypothetical protein